MGLSGPVAYREPEWSHGTGILAYTEYQQLLGYALQNTLAIVEFYYSSIWRR